jgi:hypothetical protein
VSQAVRAVDNLRVDRSAFRVDSLDDEPKDTAYWRSKQPCERWEALEILRQIVYGYDPSTARLQKFFEVADLE